VGYQTLADVTGIDPDVLSGSTELDDVSAANKMSWASERTTTRTEDVAYCLLGLFEINMPLLYGEGPRAFLRLQEEILKREYLVTPFKGRLTSVPDTNDQSLFAWKCPEGDPLSKRLSGLLSPSPAYFSGNKKTRQLPQSPSQNSAPSSMTNAGLYVRLYMHPIGSGSSRFLARLNCLQHIQRRASILWDSEEFSPEIQVINLGGDQWARVENSQVTKATRKDDKHYMYAYFKQNPSISSPSLAAPSPRLGLHSVTAFYEDAYPPDRWDISLRLLKPRKLREMTELTSVMGALRLLLYPSVPPLDGALQDTSVNISVVDVFVGPNTKKNEFFPDSYWVFLWDSNRAVTLEESFKYINEQWLSGNLQSIRQHGIYWSANVERVDDHTGRSLLLHVTPKLENISLYMC
jgi:hypothetical protein